MNERLEGAKRDVISADYEESEFFLYRSIAQSLIVVAECLENIDDALRNTVGGNPR